MSNRRDGLTLGGNIKIGATEIIEKRSRDSVHFDNKDGSVTAFYSAHLNYKDSNNNWQEIDNRWTPSQVTGWDYEMTACMYKAYVKRTYTNLNSILRLEKDGHWLEYVPGDLNWTNDAEDLDRIKSPNNVTATPSEINSAYLVQQGEIRWSGVYGSGVDFKYIPSTHFFYKELILNSTLPKPIRRITDGVNPTLELSWTFSSDLSLEINGVTWVASAQKQDVTNDILFKDSNGNTVWSWIAPKAHDANNNFVDCFMRLHGKDGKYHISVQVPYSWINDPARVYPITIDPSTYYSATDDGHIYGRNATYATARSTSYGGSDTGTLIQIGQYNISSLYYIYRGFISFVTSDIGVDSNVTAVKLNLTCQNHSHTSSSDFDVNINKHNWTSTIASNRETDYDNCLSATLDAKWQSCHSGGGTPYSGNSYDSSALSTAWIVKDGTTYYSLISSRDVSGASPASNASEYVVVYSFDYTTQSQRPQLIVTYTPKTVRSVSASVSTSTTASRVQMSVRTISETISSVLTATRLRNVLRSASSSISYAGSVVAQLSNTIGAYVRNCSVAITSTNSVIKQLAIQRTAGVAIGVAGIASRLATAVRNAPLVVNSTISVNRRYNALRNGIIGLGINSIAGAKLSFKRATSVNIGLVLTATKGAINNYIRNCGITITLSVTRILGFKKALSTSLSLTTNVTRRLMFKRKAVALLTTIALTRRIIGWKKKVYLTVHDTVTLRRKLGIVRGTLANISANVISTRLLQFKRIVYIPIGVVGWTIIHTGVTAVRKFANRINKLFNIGMGP